MKAEYLSGGLEHFNEIRALELLLFFSRAQGDVNPTAHALLDTFETLSGVFMADMDRLLAVPGVGENTAILIKLVPDLAKRFLAPPPRQTVDFNKTNELFDLFWPHFLFAQEEKALLACFDDSGNLLSNIKTISMGTVNATDVNMRNVFDAVLACKASQVLIAHNHPSGSSNPSPADIETTRTIRDGLRTVGVHLKDHLIFAGDEMTSMQKDGFLSFL
jgi:DNA repair protein RadC